MTEEVRMARGATLATAVATPVVLAVAFLAAGGKGVLGAAFGLVLAVAFFSATLLAVGAAGRVATDLMVPAALLTFMVKMVAIGMLLFLLRDTTAFDREAFALSLVAGTCVYLAAEIRFAMRARIPYVVVDEKYFRPAEVDVLQGDARKARRKLGWRPKLDFRGLVRLMVDADLAGQDARPPLSPRSSRPARPSA